MKSADPKPDFKIVGYLPDYRFNRLDPEQASHLTDIILFAAEPGPDGELILGKIVNAPWEKLWKLREDAGTRLILCLGGWGRSDSFTKAVLNKTARLRLVDELVNTLLERQLNGLDIDWEHPRTSEEWDGYVALLEQLQAAFHPHRLTLSMTVAPWRDLPERAWQAVDTVQLMSYDYGQQHSTPEQAEQDMQAFLKRGIPSQKIVLGVPFYGRNVNDRKPMTYAKIVESYTPAPAVDLVSEIYFNGPETIQRKTVTALDLELGGVMIWEIGQDSPGEHSLLQVIKETVQRPRRKAELDVNIYSNTP